MKYWLLIAFLLVGQTLFAAEKLDISKIPEPKLVAEYKFNSPISDAVFYDNGKPKVVATEAFIRFYNPDGSVRKEIKTKDIKHRREDGGIVDTRETAEISKNGEYVAVRHNLTIGFGWTKYLDRNGKILFEKDFGLGSFWVAPKGDYLAVSDPDNGISFIDSKGKFIISYPGLIIDKVVFSKDGKHCLASTMFSGKQTVILFANMGRQQVIKHEMPSKIGSIAISDNGDHFLVCGGSKMSGKSVIIMFSQKGIIWERDDNIQKARFMNNTKIVVLVRAESKEKRCEVLSLNGDQLLAFPAIEFKTYDKNNTYMGLVFRPLDINNKNILVYSISSGSEAHWYDYLIIKDVSSGGYKIKGYESIRGKYKAPELPDTDIQNENILQAGHFLVVRGSKKIQIFNILSKL